MKRATSVALFVLLLFCVCYNEVMTNNSDRPTIPARPPMKQRKTPAEPLPSKISRMGPWGEVERLDRESVEECLDTEENHNLELDNYLDKISKEPTRKFRTIKKR